MHSKDRPWQSDLAGEATEEHLPFEKQEAGKFGWIGWDPKQTEGILMGG